MCVLEIFRKIGGGVVVMGGGGVFAYEYNIIITWHKIVGSFFLRCFLLPVSILGAIFMHTSIFSA